MCSTHTVIPLNWASIYSFVCQTQTLEEEAYPALDELTSKVSTLNLERVRQIKSRLVAISGRVQKVNISYCWILLASQNFSRNKCLMWIKYFAKIKLCPKLLEAFYYMEYMQKIRLCWSCWILMIFYMFITCSSYTK